ncbi:MAG: UDP-N-acetylmuramate--L-alanine ligase [Solirubrobacterales bacterium]
MVGVGGAGMSGLARILNDLGCQVTGSDVKKSDTTERLEKSGIRTFQGHSSAYVDHDTDLVVRSTAIPDSNPEVKKAVRIGVPVIKRGQMLAMLFNRKQGIAVSGAHGKTTTTSMIAVMLEENGYDPSFMIGGELKNTNIGAKLGQGDYFVAEADESDASFLLLNPLASVVTNVEDDHLDFYHSLENLKAAFHQFTGQVKPGGFSVLYHGDPFLRGMKKDYKHLIYYGLNPEADYYADDIVKQGWGASFTVYRRGESMGRINLTIPGQHNILNALAAVALGTELGLDFHGIRQSLHRFQGAKRRFQVIGQVDGITILDDYAHHPTEVEATIEAVRQFHDHRLIVVFQPHRYSRTRQMGEQFGPAFRSSDLLIVTDVYGAGEEPIADVTGEIVYQAAIENGCNAIYESDSEKILAYLQGETRTGDFVMFMGAGDIWKLGERAKEVLTAYHSLSSGS